MQFVSPRTPSATLAAAISLCAAFATADEPAIKWLRRIDDAQQLTATTNKDLLINFTGSEWCFHCIELDREVLSKKEFAAATNDFVLVELDFPNDRDQLGELKGQYLKWVEQYLIQGYPTVVLADPTGRPYAYFVGHKSGTNPAAYLEQIHRAQEARIARDREFASAKEATGPARAQKLHAAISAVAENLGSTEDHDDDPVLVLYKSEVNEIRSLDADNVLGLKAIYDARSAARDAYRRNQAVFKDLEKFAKDDWRSAIAYLDTQIPQTTDPEIRFRLERLRVSYLEWNQQDAEALDAVRRQMADPRWTPDNQRQLHFIEAMCLRRLKRFDESIASFDRQIAAAADRPEARLSLMKWRAQVLRVSERRDDTVTAYRELVAFTKPNTDEWMEAKAGLAM